MLDCSAITTATGNTTQPSSRAPKRISWSRNAARGRDTPCQHTAAAPKAPSASAAGGAVIANHTGIKFHGTASDLYISPINQVLYNRGMLRQCADALNEPQRVFPIVRVNDVRRRQRRRQERRACEQNALALRLARLPQVQPAHSQYSSATASAQKGAGLSPSPRPRRTARTRQ